MTELITQMDVVYLFCRHSFAHALDAHSGLPGPQPRMTALYLVYSGPVYSRAPMSSSLPMGAVASCRSWPLTSLTAPSKVVSATSCLRLRSESMSSDSTG